MNRGLLLKSIREAALVTLICGLGLYVFEAFVTYIFWQYQDEFTGDFLQIKFVSDLINSMVGSRMGGPVGPSTLQSLAWVHPLVLSMFWAQVITVATRMPAGEIDSGTADVLLALPVSRWSIYTHEATVWLTSGLLLVAVAILGNLTGNLFIPPEGRLPIERIFIVGMNLFMLYAFVGALVCFLAARVNSRGRAVGETVAVLLIFFLWNFLGQYWSPAEQFEFLNVLSYYKPMPILDAGTIPWRDMFILLVTSGTLWMFGGIHFTRRDISTL